ncbi:serine O-acetyltransferase [Shouchella lonarensis]|uniref:Serine acetyltransferase n=1 Tax=Shouchella lonarensis TaxID=1464122 RepID=A0A1G6M078_9BACI|nr:serine O-acetyltransferase [Shouchella lonarensis]SDC48395.1 serine O-acetyltransferase [Shouchella lonarensis]
MGFMRTLLNDIDVVFEQDPAARNRIEVIFTYSGVHAIWGHRIAHRLWKWKLRFLARLLSQLVRFFTGIEIHPGATIGQRVFIDHGMGVVIGETCEIGNNVTIFQGVTLGGTGKEKGKRHPTVKDGALIASGAKVLGSFTIGEHARIGAGSVVLKEVPPHSTVVGIPGRIVAQHGKKVASAHALDHHALPDPVADTMREVERELERLREECTQLRSALAVRANDAGKAEKGRGDI